MKMFNGFLAAGLLAIAAPAVNADVRVTFSESLNKKMHQINRIELRREKEFRKHGVENFGNANSTRLKFEASRYKGTEWGHERAVPDIGDFSAENVIAAMFDRGIKEAAPDFKGNVHVHVEKLKVMNHSLATLRSFQTWMVGDVTIVDENGKTVDEYRISTGIVPEYSTSTRYTGRDYAFRDIYVGTRVGPIASEFSQKALNKMFPDYDAPGLVVLTLP